MHWLQRFAYCPACGAEVFEENDFKSKRCGQCGFTFYLNAAAAVVAIIENPLGELLVARRRCEPARGTLDLPGGFVDPGEPLEQALLREVEEETNLRLSTPPVYLFSLPNVYRFSGMDIPTTDAFFHVRLEGECSVIANDDVDALMWVKKKDIDPMQFGLQSIRKGLSKWLAGAQKHS